MHQMVFGVSSRLIAVAALSLTATGAVLLSPQLLGDQLRVGVAGALAAEPRGLWLAAACFAGSIACSGIAWRTALKGCGSTTSRADAIARFATGSLVNSLLPARAGSGVRIALFARTLPGEGRLLAAGGAGVAAGAARSLWTAVVIATAALVGGVPAWPAAVAALFGIVAAAAVVLARHVRVRRGPGHALDAFRALGASPVHALRLVAWSGLAVAARLGAATAIAAAVGLDSPLGSALLIVAAVDIAASLPVTPGNLGVAGAAIALVLRSAGVDGGDALAVGVAFSGLETLTSVVVGGASAGLLALRPRLRRGGTPPPESLAEKARQLGVAVGRRAAGESAGA